MKSAWFGYHARGSQPLNIESWHPSLLFLHSPFVTYYFVLYTVIILLLLYMYTLILIVCFIFSKLLVASSTSSPGVAARSLACVADVLGAMAGERAGLRSGPARNESWMDAFELLDVCSFGILHACKTPWSYKRTKTIMGVQTKAQVALYTIFH